MKSSRRASILARVLEHIENDDWDDEGDFLIFGKEEFELSPEKLTDDPHYVDEACHNELLARVKRAEGNRFIAQRISLQPIPKDPSEAEEERQIHDWLSKYSIEELAELIRELQKSPKRSFAEKRDDVADALDAALAWAAVKDLDEKFARISTLDEMRINRGSVRNAEYFEGKHINAIYWG